MRVLESIKGCRKKLMKNLKKKNIKKKFKEIFKKGK